MGKSVCQNSDRATATDLSDLLQSLVILKKEGEILEGDVDVAVAALLAVLLLGVAAARERVLVDLCLDLLRRVRQVDGRGLVRRRHFRLGALKRRDECRVDQSRLPKLQCRRDVSRHSEVRVLSKKLNICKRKDSDDRY